LGENNVLFYSIIIFVEKKNYSIIIMTSKKKFENSLFFQDIREILPKRLASPMKEIKITKTRRP
jgi:hypothetical protein